MSFVEVRGRGGIREWAIVDSDDLYLVAPYRWGMVGKGYAGAQVNRRKVYMHRFLLGLEPGDPRQGDHINGNRLDNRRSNLRIVTAAENRQNTLAIGGKYSAHRGVTYHKGERKWQAQGQLNGKHTTIGRFRTESEAVAAAAAWRVANMPYTVEERT